MKAWHFVTILLVVVCVPVGSALVSRARLSSVRQDVLAAPSDAMGILADGIGLFPRSTSRIRAVIRKPVLFPFGTWAMNDDGTIHWVTDAELEWMKKLD